MIEAAAIDIERPSPPTIGRAGQIESVGDVTAVDQGDVWPKAQAADRPRHRTQGCAADVVGVDLLDAGEDDGNAERLGENDRAELVAPGLGQRFRIIEALREIVRIENDRRDADRTCERPATDLVDSGHPAAAARHRLALEIEVRLGHRFIPSGPVESRARSKACTSRRRAMKRSMP